MKVDRYLECLADDFARLRDVAARRLAAPVPSAPEWTVVDLVRHVAEVYLHKVECIRTGVEPESWPPPRDGEPLALLDRAYAELRVELTGRPAEAPAASWYEPDQTVGFWARRMAQETVIHRVDAELAVGVPIRDIPDDLALDGIDEVLVRFLAYGTEGWPRMFTGLLPGTERRVLVDAGQESWSVRMAPTGVRIEPAVRMEPGVRIEPGNRGGGPAAMPSTGAAVLSGTPAGLLLWLWRRAGPGSIHCSGDRDAVDLLRRLLEPATQ